MHFPRISRAAVEPTTPSDRRISEGARMAPGHVPNSLSSRLEHNHILASGLPLHCERGFRRSMERAMA